MNRFVYKIMNSFLVFTLVFTSSVTGLLDTVSAAFTDSSSITLSKGTLVLFVEQNGSSYRLRNRVDSYIGSGLPQISCEVITPDGTLRQRTLCNEDFSYNNSYGDVVIYAQLDNEQATFTYNTNTQRFSSVYQGGNAPSINSNTNTSSIDCNSSNSSCTIDLSTDDSSPDLNQSVDLQARFLNGSSSLSYLGQVRFYVYKLNSANTYVTANTYSDYSMTNDRYTFTSSDYSSKTLYDYIYFRSTGTYKVRIQDDYGRYDEQTFYVGSSNTCSYNCNNTDNFSITLNDSTPDVNQYLSTTIIARNGSSTATSYNGRVNISIQYNNGGYRSTASSNDYSLYQSSVLLTNSQTSIQDNIRFFREGSYRIQVVDQDNSNIQGSIQFTVSTITNNTQSKRFDLTTNNNSPGRDNFASITILAKDIYGNRWYNYNSRVRFQVYRRMYSSDSWTEITSSSYDNSNYRIYDHMYTFSSSNNGEYYNNSFIKFYNDSYDYKVRVVDDYDSSMYGELYFYIKNPNYGNNNYSSTPYRFVGEIDPASPITRRSSDVKIYVKDSANRTITNANNRVRFEIERKTSPSSSTRRSTTSTYCDLDRTSYTFTNSDNGYIKLYDLVDCSKSGWYRLKIVDDNNSAVYGYVYFTIESGFFATSVAGYSSTQLSAIRNQYKSFMSNVNARESVNPGLAYDSQWNDTRQEFYNKLYEIVHNKSGKDLTKYSDYEDAVYEFNDMFYRLR